MSEAKSIFERRPPNLKGGAACKFILQGLKSKLKETPKLRADDLNAAAKFAETKLDALDGEICQRDFADALEWCARMAAKGELTDADGDPLEVESAADFCKEAARLAKERLRKFYESENVKNFQGEFIDYIGTRREAAETGLGDFDKFLGGGLYSGLYTIFATTGLGKTTFCLQLADALAERGTPIVYFSLEMSRNELIAKSVSRLSFEASGKKQGWTTRQILNAAQCGATNNNDFLNSCERYFEKIAPKMRIVEGIFDLTIDNIADEIDAYAKAFDALDGGKKPVIFIDYTQIIQTPPNQFTTERAEVTRITSTLKRLQRKHDLPIIAISSVSRANYAEKLSVSSGKESGAIEYSSDFVFGLEFNEVAALIEGAKKESDKKAAGKVIDDIERRKSDGEAIEVRLSNFKNRHGRNGKMIFDFTPKFNHFEPCAIADAERLIENAANRARKIAKLGEGGGGDETPPAAPTEYVDFI